MQTKHTLAGESRRPIKKLAGFDSPHRIGGGKFRYEQFDDTRPFSRPNRSSRAPLPEFLQTMIQSHGRCTAQYYRTVRYTSSQTGSTEPALGDGVPCTKDLHFPKTWAWHYLRLASRASLDITSASHKMPRASYPELSSGAPERPSCAQAGRGVHQFVRVFLASLF